MKKLNIIEFLKNTKILNRLSLYRNKKLDKTEEPEIDITFEYFQGIAHKNIYMRMYQAQYSGSTIFKQTNTKRDKYGRPKGKPITFYFIEGHDKEYSNLKTLIDLINRGVLK